MAVDLGNPKWVRMVADASTPDWLQPYNGARVAIPDGVDLPTTIDSVVINGATVWGYARNVDGETQWVMQPQPDPNVQAVNSIPGAGGWKDEAARQVYYDIGLALLRIGVPGAELRPGLKRLYDAAVAEFQARKV